MCAAGPNLQISIPKRRNSMPMIDYELATPIKFIKLQAKDFFNDYDLESHTIGTGLYGIIKRCVHKRSGLEYAVKEIPKLGLPITVVKSRGIYKQIQILKEVDHPCVLRIHEFYEDRENYYIVMDYYSGGDLFDKVLEKGSIDEHECTVIF